MAKRVFSERYVHHTLIYVLDVALCWYFFFSWVNLSVYVFTRLTDIRANNTFDFSIKARTSSLHRQIVTRSQRAYALGVMQIRLNLIVLISILFFWNIFAGYNYIFYKFLLYQIGAFQLFGNSPTISLRKQPDRRRFDELDQVVYIHADPKLPSWFPCN